MPPRVNLSCLYVSLSQVESSKASTMHAKLKMLQKHEQGMLSIERNLGGYLSDGQVMDLVSYFHRATAPPLLGQ